MHTNKVGTFMNEHPDLGPCCACGHYKPDVRNVLCLHFKAPVAGTGWGCVLCGIPMDGAVAVVCDECLEMDEPLKEICRGLSGEKQRAPYADYAGGERFDHRLERHPEFARFN